MGDCVWRKHRTAKVISTVSSDHTDLCWHFSMCAVVCVCEKESVLISMNSQEGLHSSLSHWGIIMSKMKGWNQLWVRQILDFQLFGSARRSSVKLMREFRFRSCRRSRASAAVTDTARPLLQGLLSFRFPFPSTFSTILRCPFSDASLPSPTYHPFSSSFLYYSLLPDPDFTRIW